MMKLIRIALCDDSDMERRIIRKMIDQYLEEHDYPVQVEEFSSGDALLKSDVTSYDLMILDIYMGITDIGIFVNLNKTQNNFSYKEHKIRLSHLRKGLKMGNRRFKFRQLLLVL